MISREPSDIEDGLMTEDFAWAGIEIVDVGSCCGVRVGFGSICGSNILQDKHESSIHDTFTQT